MTVPLQGLRDGAALRGPGVRQTVGYRNGHATAAESGPRRSWGCTKKRKPGFAEEAADTAGGHVIMGLVVAAVTYVGWRIGLYLVQYLV
jgi:hypothetical protein